MISIRVNEIFNYLSTDRKKDKTRTYSSVVENDANKLLGRTSQSPPPADTGSIKNVLQRREVGTGKKSSSQHREGEVLEKNIANDQDIVGNELPTDCNSSLLPSSDAPFVSVSENESVLSADSVSSTSSCSSSKTHTPDLTKTPCQRNSCQKQTPSTAKSRPAARDKDMPLLENALPTSFPSKKYSESVSTKQTAGLGKLHSQNIPVELGLSAGGSKNRKRRNRRTGDQSAATLVLDYQTPSSAGSKSQKSLLAAAINKSACPPCLVEHKSGELGELDMGCEEEGKMTLEVKKSEAHVMSPAPTISHVEEWSAVGSRSSGKLDSLKLSPAPATTRIRTTSGIADLDTFDTDLLPVSAGSVVAGMLDTHKIDALDDFDDLLPLASSSLTVLPPQPQSDEWTSVNRKCKKMIVNADVLGPLAGAHSSKIDIIVKATNANIELDRQQPGDKVVVNIRGTADQMHAASLLVAALTVTVPSTENAEKKKKRSRGGVGRSKARHAVGGMTDQKPTKPPTSDRPPRFSTNAPSSERPPRFCSIPSASVAVVEEEVAEHADTLTPAKCVSVSTATQTGFSPPAETFSSSLSKTDIGSTSPVVKAGPWNEPSSESAAESVKEYSLFDNHFVPSVELVKARRDYPSNDVALPQRTADLALLAKAPGYRAANTSSPISTAAMFESVRKFSDASSSSSVSSGPGLSLEEALWGFGNSAAPVRRPLPDSLNLDRPRSTPQPPFYGRLSPPAPFIPASAATTEDHLGQFIPTTRDFSGSIGGFGEPFRSADNNNLKSLCGPQDQFRIPDNPTEDRLQYSNPSEPMTLPHIATDLNPNAPDFVYPAPISTMTTNHFSSSAMPASAADVLESYLAAAVAAESPIGSYSSSAYLDTGNRSAASDIDCWPSCSYMPDSGRGSDVVYMPGCRSSPSIPLFGGLSALQSPSSVLREQWCGSGHCMQESVTFG